MLGDMPDLKRRGNGSEAGEKQPSFSEADKKALQTREWAHSSPRIGTGLIET